MALSTEEKVDRLIAMAFSQQARLTFLDTTIRTLLVTHPRPERLRAAFATAGQGIVDRYVNSRIPEEALEDVRNLFQTYLKLIDTAPRDR